MKKKTKRFLASFLVVMLMMAPLSVNAYADDGETESAPQTIEQSDPAAEPALFSADEPAADTPASDTPASDVPAADVPASDVPASDVPAADVPASDAPAADTGAAPANVPSKKTRSRPL